MNEQKCDFCEYDWVSRVEAPKACPRCKRRFDYPSVNGVEDLKSMVEDDEFSLSNDEGNNNL